MAGDDLHTGNPSFTVRQARMDDHEQVTAFTEDTWEGGDYIPDVFPEWVETDGPTQRTLVAEVDGEDALAGIVSIVLVSETEAWGQGLRVNPDYRGHGISTKMTLEGFDWARSQGATVIRNMVFSWNGAGLGQSRHVGYRPTTEFRWVHPEPGTDGIDARPRADEDLDATHDPDVAWRYWADSDARDHLRGLGLTTKESWALSEITREDLHRIADDTAVFAVESDDGARGMAYRTRTYERGGDEEEPTKWAEYGVGAWEDLSAGRELLSAVAADAAAVDAEKTRVLVPETCRYVSDAAYLRVDIAEEPDFVLAADLTADYRSKV